MPQIISGRQQSDGSPVGTQTTIAVNSDGSILTSEQNYEERYAYNSSNMVEYVGRAPVGSATSASVWQIYKLEYTNNMVTAKKWADNTSAFTKVWDDRTGYTYGA